MFIVLLRYHRFTLVKLVWLVLICCYNAVAIGLWGAVCTKIDGKAERPSVCTFGTLITQPCQHELKRDLLEMKAMQAGFNYRAWHYKISRDEKIGSHFVGQKEN